MERSRRNVQSRGAKVAGVLAELQAAREGKGAKRVDKFEVKQEEAVFDVVDDAEYEQLVAKRRLETAEFVEDDDGAFMEDDEPDLNGGDGGDEEGDAAGDGRKRKGAGGKDGGPNKKKAPERDAKARDRMQAMFAKAAARSAAAAAVGHRGSAEDDALLDNILSDLGGAPAKKPAAPAAAGANPFARPGAPRTVAAAAAPMVSSVAAPKPQITKTFSRAPAGGRGGAAGAPLPAPARLPAVAGPPAPARGVKRAAVEEAAGADDGDVAPMEDDGYDAYGADGAPGDDLDDATAAPAGAPGGDGGFSFDTPAKGAKLEPLASPAKVGGGTPSAAAAGAETAGAGAGGAAAEGGGPAADKRRLFADSPAPAAGAAAAAATGWEELFADGGGGGGGAGHEAPADADAGSPGPAAAAAAADKQAGGGAEGLPLDQDGNMPFYLIDAYENPDRPDTLYLFGKARYQKGWGSCCAVVPNMQRSLLVVPAPHVFGPAAAEIAALEAAAKDEAAAAAVTAGGGAGEPPAAAAPAGGARLELLKLLHSRSADLKAELRALLLRHGVKSMRVVPVKRSYAFEEAGVPHGEQWVLKIRYPASEPAVPAGVQGEHFRAIFGARQSPLEALVLKRRVMGPGWVLLAAPRRREGAAMVSWCKLEVELPGPKALLAGKSPAAAALRARAPPPPLTAAALTLRLHTDPRTQQPEILAASVVHLTGVAPDTPMPRAEWSSPRLLRNFSLVRKLEGRPWPPGYEASVAADNASPRGQANGGGMVLPQPNERALLGCLLAKLQALDADVLVGHNISAFDLSVLLHRLQALKCPLWSRVGRLKRSTFPKLTGGGHIFGGGASAGLLTCLAGRLLCDTYLASRDLVREVDYTLKTLAASLLEEVKQDVSPAQVVAAFDSAAGVRGLLTAGESDAWLSLGLMFHLSVLPLSKQLANLSGSVWSKVLQGARSQRIEMLLLHEFHRRKFMTPDKMWGRDRADAAAAAAAKGAKGKKAAKSKAGGAGGAGGGGGADEDGPPPPHDGPECDEGDAEDGVAAGGAAAPRGRPKGPQYAGGLVLEPKKGLYDKIVIMLDFNSLYPSIIQEYNICFTTVQRPPDGSIPPLPTLAGGSAAANNGAAGGGGGAAPLPLVIQGLVQERRKVKALMKGAKGAGEYQRLNIQQQALKLTANSMYGCLGFANSRFYARPLAELITSQGREILQSTVDLVANMGGGLEVVYGDTDSIMIHTGTDDLAAARALGAAIKREVNKRYRLLEIELDAVFRTMLLLKKKKYAAVKIEPSPSGALTEVLEAKGLDIVRRDWCGLSKDAGNYALQQILSGQPKEEVVSAVHEYLRGVTRQLDDGAVPLGKFVITKQLTKRLEDYPDAKNQPHVQVALRRRAAGKRDGTSAGETVPYVICVRLAAPQAAAAAAAVGAGDGGADAGGGAAAEGAGQQQVAAAGASGSSGGGGGGGARAAGGGAGHIAERAYHPDELREDATLAIDREYYLAQQVHPVVSRLCAPIEGTDPQRLAECLGLDPSRFSGGGGSGGSGGSGGGMAWLREEALQATGSLLDSDAHYASCAPLVLTAPNGTRFEFKGVRAALKAGSGGEALLTPPDAVGDAAAAVAGARLANQALLAARSLVVQYYEGRLVADDEPSQPPTRDVSLAPPPLDAPPGSLPAPAGGGGAGPGVRGGGGGGGVLVAREVTEDKLYTHLCHLHRLVDARGALDAMNDKGVRDQAAKELGAPALQALDAAAKAVGALRDASAYRWVDLGGLFGRLRRAPGGVPGAAGAAAAAAAARTPAPRGAGWGTPVSGRR